MFPLRRAAARSAQQNFTRSTRRYASHESHGHSAHSHHAEPVSESFGKGFYVAFGAPIVFYALYQMTQSESGSIPVISSLIDKYTEKQDEYQRRMTLHMAAADQAAYDKNLFAGENKSGLQAGIDLRYPEQFNNGSPRNVQAGNGGADLNKLIGYYQQQQEKAEAARLANIKDGKVTTVYDTA